ncbi:MAG: hypothetical protein M3308_00660 [Actinomycetota bacterium]|nr:hypothetical protein [Actinomycetota bacterium]
MFVPGLYGFVSATKWTVDMELTTFDDKIAYWRQEPRKLGNPCADQDNVADRQPWTV